MAGLEQLALYKKQNIELLYTTTSYYTFELELHQYRAFLSQRIRDSQMSIESRDDLRDVCQDLWYSGSPDNSRINIFFRRQSSRAFPLLER